MRNQEAAQPIFACLALLESLFCKDLWILTRMDPSPYERGGASLPLVVQNLCLLIDDESIELIGKDSRPCNQ